MMTSRILKLFLIFVSSMPYVALGESEPDLLPEYVALGESEPDLLPEYLLEVPVLITNAYTGRYLFQDGSTIDENSRGVEGGWSNSPMMKGTDENYYNRAVFTIHKLGDDGEYIIENLVTKRYAFSSGDPIDYPRGSEEGWAASSGFEAPQVVGVDANYYGGAVWRVELHDDYYLFVNKRTERYLFSDGDPVEGHRGDEQGWLASTGFEAPEIKGTDENYYNRAAWAVDLF